MKWTIATIGRPRLGYARDGMEEYASRIRKFASLDILSLKAANQTEESRTLLDRTTGAYRIVLDERGRALRSLDLAERVRRLELDGISQAAVLIGGADGHQPIVRDSADLVLSLSALTLQHELALVVVLEQLYRAYAILRGLPYHRE